MSWRPFGERGSRRLLRTKQKRHAAPSQCRQLLGQGSASAAARHNRLETGTSRACPYRPPRHCALSHGRTQTARRSSSTPGHSTLVCKTRTLVERKKKHAPMLRECAVRLAPRLTTRPSAKWRRAMQKCGNAAPHSYQIGQHPNGQRYWRVGGCQMPPLRVLFTRAGVFTLGKLRDHKAVGRGGTRRCALENGIGITPPLCPQTDLERGASETDAALP